MTEIKVYKYRLKEGESIKKKFVMNGEEYHAEFRNDEDAKKYINWKNDLFSQKARIDEIIKFVNTDFKHYDNRSHADGDLISLLENLKKGWAMMTERDFVLNNFYMVQLNSNALQVNFPDNDVIDSLKQTYKTICENTSEEGDDDFIFTIPYKKFVRIKYKSIDSVSIESFNKDNIKYIVIHLEGDESFTLCGEECERFKQWFERKRG